MQLVKIDMIELHPLEAGVQAVGDVRARRAAVVRSLAGLPERLGRNQDIAARNAEVTHRRARHHFGLAARIDVCRVDEVHSGVERAPDELIGTCLIDAADRAPLADPEGHRAEAQFGYEQARPTQLVVTHSMPPAAWRHSAKSPRRIRASWLAAVERSDLFIAQSYLVSEF